MSGQGLTRSLGGNGSKLQVDNVGLGEEYTYEQEQEKNTEKVL